MDSRLLGTIINVIWNSIELMRNTKSGLQIDGKLEWSVIHTRRVENAWIMSSM